MSLSDIIVFYENEIIPIQTEIGSLRLDNCNDLYFVYSENVILLSTDSTCVMIEIVTSFL